jgi:transcriptional regulator with XRE-family HTH domain
MAPQETFSEQLRKIIEECGTSRYALCQQAGISEAVLSRFLAGRQGITLTTLNKLAAALGLSLSAPVGRVPRPRPRGRKPQKGSRVNMTAAEWKAFAHGAAKDAHENHFPSRRGVWHFEDLDVLVLYNNNPYAKFPTIRDEETAEFRRRLAAEGIKELAYSTYPVGGESDGYTYAMVIDASQDRQNWVADTMFEILGESNKRMWVPPLDHA